jgi:hypothetical protein
LATSGWKTLKNSKTSYVKETVIATWTLLPVGDFSLNFIMLRVINSSVMLPMLNVPVLAPKEGVA